jgi:uncharacterized protein
MRPNHISTLTQPTVKVAPELSRSLELLYQLVAPTWPLATAVACNPLQGLETLPFAEATRVGQDLFDGDTLPGLWQLRQGRMKGGLSQADFDQAVSIALTELPNRINLGKQQVQMHPLGSALVNQLDETKKEPQASARLTHALNYLDAVRPWGATVQTVNQEILPWLGAFLDEGQAAWPMPYRKQGLFVAVKALLSHDKRFRGQRAFLRELPTDSFEAIKILIDRLSISDDHRDAYLRDQLLALPGWAAFIRWRSEQDTYQPQLDYPANLTDYLALRLLLAWLVPDDPKVEEPQPPRIYRRLSTWAESFLAPGPETTAQEWAELIQTLRQFYRRVQLELLAAWEGDFQNRLRRQLISQTEHGPATHRPEAQLAFCIDVRSEPFRRQVEAAGDYETLGFAGFFGLPIAYQTVLGKTVNSLPVLLKPAHQLKPQAGACCAHQAPRHEKGLRLITDLKQAYKSLKYNLATPFAAVEALGMVAGLITAGRNLMPRTLTKLRRKGQNLISPDIDIVPDVTPQGEYGIPLAQQAVYAGNALRMMGLTRNFAPLVVLCGHGSETENNPYAAALDCGACGGSHGGPNASAMARIFNQPEIRAKLREEGIDIPADTLFVGGQHNTTTDEVRLLDLPELDSALQVQINDLRAGLKRAQRGNLAVRAHLLGQTEAAKVLRKSSDWSEVRPEWGLAGNAGFVVAPRHMTEKLDLKGRCFLHSYDWEQDPENSSLEVIMTAPLVVAQWINSQYFFSTVDNTAFGSGSKITHNVVGKVGIMQGNASDLMHGLPLQSVMATDEKLYHQPLRLTAMVVAPQVRVQALIDKHQILQQMFFNQWVTLQIFDPEQEQMLRLQANGNWIAVA